MTTATRTREKLDDEIAETRNKLAATRDELSEAEEHRRRLLAAEQLDTQALDRADDGLARLRRQREHLETRLATLTDPDRQAELLRGEAEERAAELRGQINEEVAGARRRFEAGVSALRSAAEHLDAALVAPEGIGQAARDLSALATVFGIEGEADRLDLRAMTTKAQEALKPLKAAVREADYRARPRGGGGSVRGLLSGSGSSRRALSRDLSAFSRLSPEVREMLAPILRSKVAACLEGVPQQDRHIVNVPSELRAGERVT